MYDSAMSSFISLNAGRDTSKLELSSWVTYLCNSNYATTVVSVLKVFESVCLHVQVDFLQNWLFGYTIKQLADIVKFLHK